jgi:hypothetical protein
MPGLEELRRVVRRCKHPFDEPAALEVPAAVREVGLLTDQEEDGTPLSCSSVRSVASLGRIGRLRAVSIWIIGPTEVPLSSPTGLPNPASAHNVGDAPRHHGNQSLAQAMPWPRTETWG